MKLDCNCCQKNSWKKLYTLHDFMYGKRSEDYTYYQCQNCGLISLDIEKTPEKISKLYPEDSYYSYQKQDTLLGLKALCYRVVFMQRSGLLNNILGAALFPLSQMMRGLKLKLDAKVLDVGSGSGKFLSLIKKLGMKPFGVEISKVAIESSKKITDQLYLGNFEDIMNFKFPENEEMKFDQIVSNHVIEHALDPNKFISNMSKLIKDDGLIIFATPNYKSLYSIIFGKYWAQLDCPRHLNIFSPKNIEIYCKRHSLEIRKVRYLSNEFGFSASLIYILEDKFGIQLPQSFKKSILLTTKIILLPLYTTINLIGLGDTAEYWIVKN